MRVVTAVLAALTLLFAAAVSEAVDFWPMPAGMVYTYQYPSGNQVTVRYATDNLRGYYTEGTFGETFRIDGDGDVTLTDAFRFEYLMELPNFYLYDPPVKFLDLPLEVGKEWSTNTYVPMQTAQRDIIGYRVVSFGSVTVPFGTFDAYEIEESSIWGRRGTYFVNRELGPIVRPGDARLVSIEAAVPVEETSWGSVKSLFR